MSSDYEAITKHNERQLGLDTASRKTQICMYSDATHFIYELLQNADDYGATEISFSLRQEELVIEHNGEPFAEENVKAITYFGKSTSADDLVKTGRFGVGFKSVCAFTATPTIMSGDESFRIYRLYRVAAIPRPSDLPETRTRILLPFNHDVEKPDYVEDLMSADDAYEKISSRLTGLNMNTLLFTRNIREIHWEIDGYSGHYLREDRRDANLRWTSVTDGDALDKYLVFSRVPMWHSQEHKPVEIAFLLSEKDEIVVAQGSLLYVLFATTQETHLQFLLNGPYRTNPSRETISESDQFNVHLMKESAVLLKESLPTLRDRGLLTPQFLGVLPNPNDELRDFYCPLRETAVAAFQEDRLVPTDDGGFAEAKVVLQAPARIREVVTTEELPHLAGEERTAWAKGVQQNSRADYFLRSLDILQWSWEELEEALTSRYGRWYYGGTATPEEWAWLKERPDSWMQKLYMLLGEAIRKDDCSKSSLSHCQIIRARAEGDEEHVSAVRAYFPKGRGYRDLPQVKRAILRGRTKDATKKIEESLVALGVKEIGEEERVDLILETYYSEKCPAISKPQHLHHMGVFIKWWKKKRDADKFKGQTIFRVVGGDDFFTAQDCYIDAPLRTTGLRVLYDKASGSIDARRRLWTSYREIASEEFCDFAVACGALDRVPFKKKYCRNRPCHPQWREMYEGLSGTRETSSQIDRDYVIPELEEMLGLRNRKVNLLIWNTMRKADPRVLKAEYRPNQRYNTRRRKSSVVLQLSNAEWLPDKRGRMHKPADVTQESLHPDFTCGRNDDWLEAIGFGETARKQDEEYKHRQQLASQLGVDGDLIDLLRSLPENDQKEAQKQFSDILRRKKEAQRRAERAKRENVPYHEALAATFLVTGKASTEGTSPRSSTSRNPARRQAKLAKQVAEAMQDEPSSSSRYTLGLCRKWKGKNDRVKTALAEWYAGKCQICGKTFTKRNGQPYFEGLYLVPFTTAEWVDRPGNVVCLCAWHSAMFQFGAKSAEESIADQVICFEPGASAAQIKMQLCGESVAIEFAEDHLLELKVMLTESLKQTAGGKDETKQEE